MRTINAALRVYVGTGMAKARMHEAYILAALISMALISALAVVISAHEAGAMPDSLTYSNDKITESFPSAGTPSSGSVVVP
jgi:hypothetical protein